MKNLTHEHLLKRLDYNPETGSLFWKKRYPIEFKSKHRSPEAICKTWNARYEGREAGCLNSNGYTVLAIDDKKYYAHRLCYFHYHGYMPENDIDHKKRIKHDNRIKKIREVSKQCNMRNSKIRKDNTSGIKGVGFDKKREKWIARISPSKKEVHLGRFDIFNDAVVARWEAEVKYKFPNCDTSSSAYNYLKENSLI